MADSASMEASSRQDCLFVAAGATRVAAVGAIRPSIDPTNPATSILAAASAEVDLSHIAEARIGAVPSRKLRVPANSGAVHDLAAGALPPYAFTSDTKISMG